jgi:cbb3-type cytochrome oxidase cytochrome c subunit
MGYIGFELVGGAFALGLIAKLLYNKFIKSKMEDEPETKLCKDCKWCEIADPKIYDEDGQYRFAMCRAPKNRLPLKEESNRLVHPTLGVRYEYDFPFCSGARARYQTMKNCGPKGKWFERKEKKIY